MRWIIERKEVKEIRKTEEEEVGEDNMKGVKAWGREMKERERNKMK